MNEKPNNENRKEVVMTQSPKTRKRHKNLMKRGDVYYFKMVHDGKQIWRSLGTGDLGLAAKLAADRRRQVIGERFDELEATKKRRDFTSLGAVMDEYRQSGVVRDLAPATITQNLQCLCHLVRGHKSVRGDGTADVEQQSTAVLGRELVERYTTNQMTEAGNDLLARDRASRTAAATARQARAVFAKWALDKYAARGMRLPDLSGFLNGGGRRAARVKYRLPPQALIEATKAGGRKLKETSPELYVIYLLAYDQAMRAGEIAAATWDWIRTDADGRHYMEIIRRANFRPKGLERAVPIHDTTLRELKEIAGGRSYLVAGDKPTHRKNLIKRTFSAWMRELGWSQKEYPKASHELRKLMGSVWFTKLGPAVAQKWLGHASVATTCAFYADLVEQPLPLERE